MGLFNRKKNLNNSVEEESLKPLDFSVLDSQQSQKTQSEPLPENIEGMGIEELKALAEKGHIQAAYKVGCHYFQLQTADGIEEAVKWFDMAADKGVYMAARSATACYRIQFLGGLTAANHFAEYGSFVFDDAENVFKSLQREAALLDRGNTGATQKHIEAYKHDSLETAYDFSAFLYKNGLYQGAVDIIKNRLEVEKCRLIYAGAIIKNALENNTGLPMSAHEMADIVQFILVYNSKYDPKPDGSASIDAYAHVVCFLSSYLRTNGCVNDAVELLDRGLNMLGEDPAADEMKEIRARYVPKKIGSGYKYV